MPNHDPTPMQSEYSLRVSLLTRGDKGIAIFRVDSRVGRGEYRTILLQRATTPLDTHVLAEWATLLDAMLSNAVERRCGVQLSLLDESGKEVEVTEYTAT